MPTDLSVITCTHNPRKDYLKQVLDALNNQTLDKLNWEYLLVDNSSNEPCAETIDLSWHPRARHLREDKLGLTHARLRGIAETTGEILVFVDDDNVLDNDYLEHAIKIGRDWPLLGVWGGQARPRFETPPPEWTRYYWSRLVIREFDQDRWTNQPSQAEAMPCGAGMCVRRNVAAYYVELHSSGARRILLDRSGPSLVSGGDSDLAICACDLGLGMGLFASLKLTHLISPTRLTEDYLVNLVEGLAYSSVVLNSLRSSNGLPKRTMTTAAADLMRLLIRKRRERRFFRAVRHGERRALQSLKNG